MRASLLSTEFAIAKFEQENKDLPNELNNLKVSLRFADISRANAKANADRTESKLEVLEKVTSDLLEGNKEVKQQLEEATSQAESLQSELLKAFRTITLLKQKLDGYDLANKCFQEFLTKKTNQTNDQTKVEKLVKLQNNSKLSKLGLIFNVQKLSN